MNLREKFLMVHNKVGLQAYNLILMLNLNLELTREDDRFRISEVPQFSKVPASGAWAIIEVSGHQYRRLANGYDLEIGHF